MPEAYTVTEAGSESLRQVFETEDEANVFVARAEGDARVLLLVGARRLGK
jgi:hypothetical protein